MFEMGPVADQFKTQQASSIPIRLDGKSSHEIELTLRPATPLTGIVLGADGKPQADVEIEASFGQNAGRISFPNQDRLGR